MAEEWAQKAQTSVSLKTLLETGSGRLLQYQDQRFSSAVLQVASFLHRELPVRFAHRIRDLSELPHGLGEMPAIKEVQQWYEDSLVDVVSFPPIVTQEDDAAFLRLLARVYTRHADTLVTVARGLHEFERSERGQEALAGGRQLADITAIHEFLDRFFISRIGIRMLIGQYLELHESPQSDYTGLLCLRTSPAQVAAAAAEDARYMCERQLGDAPEVELLGSTDLTFAYVPSHLYYILFELLKNSMRAVAEHHSTGTMPDIRVVIADGEENEDVVIKVSDLGGGIPRSNCSRIFSYLFTTAHTAFPADLHDFGRENPLAGLGYGLPIGRGYARYFGGDLNILSMEGHGTDAFLHLSRLGDNEEPLP